MSAPAPAKTQPPESKCRQRLRANLRQWLFKPPTPPPARQKSDAVDLTGRPVLTQYTEVDDEHVAKVGPERTLAWRPADAPSILDEVRAPVKLMLYQNLAVGDVIMLTAAVRDLKAAWGDKFQVDVRTAYPELLENNPHLTRLSVTDPEVNKLHTHYTWWVKRFNELPFHFVSAIRLDLEQRLGLVINQGDFRGDLHFTEDELTKPNLAQQKLGDRRYWVVDAGGKFDFTVKWWGQDNYQAVIERLPDIQFVQIGRNNDPHPRLQGANVLNLLGQTSLRELLRVIYTADGVITPISLPMHAAAAVPPHPRTNCRPHCVVIAGGREPPTWEAYPTHAYLHTCGKLDCCRDGGCSKSRVELLKDGRVSDAPGKLCLQPVKTAGGQTLPKCMTMITVDDVERAVRSFQS